MCADRSYDEDPRLGDVPEDDEDVKAAPREEHTDSEDEVPSDNKKRIKNPFSRNKKDKKDKKEKKEKPEKPPKQKPEKQTDNTKEENKMNKLKGLFRKKKPDPADVSSDTKATELTDELSGVTHSAPSSGEATPQKIPLDQHPGSLAMNPSQTLTREPTTMDSMKRFWSRPPPVYEGSAERAELAPPTKKSWARCSVIIIVLLIIGFVVGIVITALAGDDVVMQVVGPAFIVLSLFALIGKVFYTLSQTPESHAALKPVARQINVLMYGPGGKRSQPETNIPIQGYIIPPNQRIYAYTNTVYNDPVQAVY